MSDKLWDFWADHYDHLWVQKHSLGPTRAYILETLANEVKKGALSEYASLLDLGCGSGQLLREIADRWPGMQLTGIDFSKKMLGLSSRRNPEVRHYHLNAMELECLQERFDFIICTHSLPYYPDARHVLHQIAGHLTQGGKLIMGFASGNSLYDRIVLAPVKLTTGKASYPSDAEFRTSVRRDFRVLKFKVIRHAFYMPRIAVYTLAPKPQGRENRP